GILTVVDNTFASPINQRPLSLGVDLVLHSGTKYLGGHNDLPYGALTSIRSDLKETILSVARVYGGSLSPYECYQAERSIKTLAIRVQRQNSNAFKLAEYLSRSPYIEQVYYPGLPSHQGHQLALIQRSEEHTSELQSREKLVCRLLLEKKKLDVSIWIVKRTLRV